MDILSTSGINNLISQSKSAEYERRIYPLVAKKNRFSSLSTTWNDLSTKLKSFKTLLDKFKDVDAGGSFAAKKAELTSDEYFSAIAKSASSLSSYNIRVNQLAKNDMVMSDTVTSSDLAGLSAGTHKFQVSSGEASQDIEIEATGTETKEELMELISEAINEALGDSVSASVFSPKSGESKLSVVSKETGETNAIIIKDLTGTALNSIGMNFQSRTQLVDDGTGGYSNTLSDLNAKLTLNGVSVERSSNVIDDLINDVTLTLKNEMEVGIPTVNVIVKNNTEAIRKDLDDFISKFNESYKFVKDQYFTDEDGQRGLFVGNATALGLLKSFSDIAYQQVEGMPETDLSYLSEAGIKFDPNSGLSISDNDRLKDVLETKPEQLGAIFNSENGVANKLYDLVDSYISTDGVISNLVNSYDSSISYLSDKITYKEKQVDKNAEVLRYQYENMQLQLAEMLNTQNLINSLGLTG